MNTIKQLFVVAGCAGLLAACQGAQDQSDTTIDSLTSTRNAEPMVRSNNNVEISYIDLSTGQPASLYYDKDKQVTYFSNTHTPVDLYVNTLTHDTVYGRGRLVVNGYLVKTTDGKYKLDDKKVKIEGDKISIREANRQFEQEKGGFIVKDGDSSNKASGEGQK